MLLSDSDELESVVPAIVLANNTVVAKTPTESDETLMFSFLHVFTSTVVNCDTAANRIAMTVQSSGDRTVTSRRRVLFMVSEEAGDAPPVSAALKKTTYTVTLFEENSGTKMLVLTQSVRETFVNCVTAPMKRAFTTTPAKVDEIVMLLREIFFTDR